MKIFSRLNLLAIAALSTTMLSAEAAQTERSIRLTLSGFYQDINTNVFPAFTNAVPFRATTKDVLEEISQTTGQNFTNGVLLWIESLPQSTNASSIVARKVTAGITNQLDVSQFFSVDLGEEVKTLRSSRGMLKGKTFYAIDQFQFSTLMATNGEIALTLQGLSRQTEVAFTRIVGGNTFSGFAANLASEVNGELFGLDGFIGPVKGRLAIGPPKFVATP